MKKTITITLKLTLADLSDDERHQAAYEIGLIDEEGNKLHSDEEDDGELPGVKDIETSEFVDLFRGNESVFDEEFFAGSGIYARVVDVDVVEHGELEEDDAG